MMRKFAEAGINVTEPRYYPEYAPDYYATFFEDPDGIRFEVVNFREMRRKVMYDWEARTSPVRLRELACAVRSFVRDAP